MKRKIPYILSIAVMAASLTGCLSESTMGEEDFVSKVSDISLIVNWRTQMKFDEDRHQIAYNEISGQFRVMDDDLNNYFVITLGSMPGKVGDVVPATIVYTTQDDIPQVTADFTVSKYENDMFWLWNDGKKIGTVIRILH